MAANSGRSVDEALSKEDLPNIVDELSPVAHKYKMIGIRLSQVELNDIKNIEADCSGTKVRLLEVISFRLQKLPDLTWKEIYRALKSPSVGESRIAEGIQTKFGHSSSDGARYESHEYEKSNKECEREAEIGDHSTLHLGKSRSNQGEDDENRTMLVAEKINQQPGTINGASMLKVSQSVSPSSPVLAKYKQYLQSVYRARVLAPADKYLPTLKAPFINLAMIKYSPEQRDEFTRQTLHGGVDQILESKTPINIEDLLTPEEGGRPVRFILVEGPPGIGKSTFAWEVCRRWDEIESLRDYDTVVLLKLREKWVLNAASLYDIFRYDYDPELPKIILQELAKTHGKNLLLVLDGFDEVSHSFHENSIIKKILCKQLLPECTIILTSRPVAKSHLDKFCQPNIDKHVEIIGFTEEERVRYITEVFSKEPEVQVNFLKYMFLVPHIKSMMYIPLNCAIMALVYHESQKRPNSAIPKTITQLYKVLTHLLLHRDMTAKGIEHKSMLPEGLCEGDKKKFKTLANFAFYQYHESKMITVFKEDIPDGFVHFGLMNESTEMYATTTGEKTFSFLHLSLQEYLSAWHLAHACSIDFQMAYHRLAVESQEKTTVFDSPLDYEDSTFKKIQALESTLLIEPAKFLAGITCLNYESADHCNPWEAYLCSTTEKRFLSPVLYSSVYEAQNRAVLKSFHKVQAGSSAHWQVCVDKKHTPTSYDCYALLYCVAGCPDQIDLSLDFKHSSESLVETFCKGLYDHFKNTRIKRLQLRMGIVPVHEYIPWLTEAFNETKCMAEIEELKVVSKMIEEESFFNFLLPLKTLKSLDVNVQMPMELTWARALQSLPELEMLTIANWIACDIVMLSVPHLNFLCFLIQTRLREIELNINFGAITLDYCLERLLEAALSSHQLQKFAVPHVCRKTMPLVHNLLLHSKILTTLKLTKTNLGYDGILYICKALRINKTLKHIEVTDDDFRQCIPSANIYRPFYFILVERNILPTKITCTEFLLELNDILKQNNTLETMTIEVKLFHPVDPGLLAGFAPWTGRGPLEQFNIQAVGSDTPPLIKKSFSLPDLAETQCDLYWWRNIFVSPLQKKTSCKHQTTFCAFTSPDRTDIPQAFSHLDPRLKECLQITEKSRRLECFKLAYYGFQWNRRNEV